MTFERFDKIIDRVALTFVLFGIFLLSIGYAYRVGKRDADQWYAKNPRSVYLGPTGIKVECVAGKCAVSHYDVPRENECGYFDKDAPGGVRWGPCSVPLSSITDDGKLLNDGDVIGTNGREFIYDRAHNKWMPLTGDIVRNDVCGACNTQGKCWEIPCSSR